ncbi:MAG: hypothetical protein V4721_02895 [Bacteroidota bacterium]
MKHNLLLLAGLLVLSVSRVLAQDAANTVRETPAAKTSSLTLAAIYGNNANYYGQTAEERLPYLLTNASYRLVNGVYFSASGYQLLTNSQATFEEVDLSAGYDVDLATGLIGSVGYTRSFFAKNSPLLQAANENTLSASVTYDWKLLKSSLSSFYAFGKTSDVFLTLNNSKSMDLGSLFSDKDYISFEPGFEIASGTVQYLEEYIVRRENQIQIPGAPRVPEYTTRTRSASTFDMLSYSANFLLGYNRSHYLIETGYQLSYLGSHISTTNRKPRSFFNLSLYYQF